MIARHGRPSRRSAHPRRHAARRGRPEPVPQGSRGIADADHHAHRARRGCRPHRWPRNGCRRLSRKALQSARTAGADQCGAAPPGRGAGSRAPPRARVRSPSRAGGSISACANCAIRRRARRDDQRRVRPAADLLRAAGPRAVARQPARPDAGAQCRFVRALDRRAGQPHPPQDRARSAGCNADQDRALRRLSVHADRPRRWRRAATDHEAARLSQSERHRRTDRSAGGGFDHRAASDHHRKLPDQPAGPARRVRVGGQHQLAVAALLLAADATIGAAAAARRSCARISAARARNPASGNGAGCDGNQSSRLARIDPASRQSVSRLRAGAE